MVSYLKKDRFTVDTTARSTYKIQENPLNDISCDVCSKVINFNSDDGPAVLDLKRNHYLSECTAVPGKPVGNTVERSVLLERIAALGLIKKLGHVDHVLFDFNKTVSDVNTSVDPPEPDKHSRKGPPD